MAFEKPGDYGVADVQVTADGKRIDAADDPPPNRTVERSGRPWSRVEIDVPVSGRGRQVEILVTRPAGCGRLLIGELAIETGATSDAVAELPRPGRMTTTPHRVKSVLDRELLDAGVQFLYGCYATDTLVDGDGRPAGIVMANRAGHQAVVAKVIIDATDRATVARLAGAEQRPWPDDFVEFERVVLLKGTSGKPQAVHHQLRFSMPDGSYRSFARAEQEARDATYQDGQLRASESLFFVPPDPIITQRGGEPGLGPFRLAAGSRLYVLSGCADVPRNEAAPHWAAARDRPGTGLVPLRRPPRTRRPDSPGVCDRHPRPLLPPRPSSA